MEMVGTWMDYLKKMDVHEGQLKIERMNGKEERIEGQMDGWM